MRSLLLLALLLSACAAPYAHGPGFRQAAMRPAPYQPPPAYTPGYAPGTPAEPVYTPQGAGAYRGDQLPAAPVPRSPNKRVLPATGEAGVWAADGDPALSSASKPLFTLLPLFGVSLSYSLEYPRVDWFINQCVAGMRDATKKTGQEDVINALPPPVRECFAARAVAFCMDAARNEFIESKWSYDRSLPNYFMHAANGAVASAVEAVARHCLKATSDGALREMLEDSAPALSDVTTYWKRVESARQPNRFLP